MATFRLVEQIQQYLKCFFSRSTSNTDSEDNLEVVTLNNSNLPNKETLLESSKPKDPLLDVFGTFSLVEHISICQELIILEEEIAEDPCKLIITTKTDELTIIPIGMLKDHLDDICSEDDEEINSIDLESLT